MALFDSVLYVFFQFICVDYRPLLFDLFVAVSSTRDKVSQPIPLLMHLSLDTLILKPFLEELIKRRDSDFQLSYSGPWLLF